MRPVTDLQRTVAPFEVISEYEPAGDQPTAIAELAQRVRAGEQDIVLLGATGTGKSATTAWLIEEVQRPTLVMAPNKTLAAQLANEFRELLPNNAVEYFVSYYDYFQPEAYVPQTDTYIEKDSSLNEEVERLRHSATNSLLTRRDVIVVATVSPRTRKVPRVKARSLRVYCMVTNCRSSSSRSISSPTRRLTIRSTYSCGVPRP